MSSEITLEELKEDLEGETPIEEAIPEDTTVVVRDDDTLRVEIDREGGRPILTYRDPDSGDVVLKGEGAPDGDFNLDLPSLDPTFWTLTLDGEETSLQDLEGLENASMELDADNRAVHIEA